MKFFIMASMKCKDLFATLTKETQIHYLNYTLETQDRNHLAPFFQLNLEEIIKLKSYKLDEIETNYKQDLTNNGKKLTETRKKQEMTEQQKNKDIEQDELSILSDNEILEKIETLKKSLKGKLEKLESGLLLHYSVAIGAAIFILPTLLVLNCCFSAKAKRNWDQEIETFKAEVQKEEQIFDKELKKVMDDRKYLEQQFSLVLEEGETIKSIIENVGSTKEMLDE